jgi:hypothetical protein
LLSFAAECPDVSFNTEASLRKAVVDSVNADDDMKCYAPYLSDESKLQRWSETMLSERGEPDIAFLLAFAILCGVSLTIFFSDRGVKEARLNLGKPSQFAFAVLSGEQYARVSMTENGADADEDTAVDTSYVVSDDSADDYADNDGDDGAAAAVSSTTERLRRKRSAAAANSSATTADSSTSTTTTGASESDSAQPKRRRRQASM